MEFTGSPYLGLGAGEPSERPRGKTTKDHKDSSLATAAKDPSNEQDRIKYGVISEVSDNSMVKVRLLNNKGELNGSNIVSGAFLPVINPLSQIHFAFGSLCKGQFVRVFWRGKLSPNTSTIVEVIANEGHKFLQKDRKSNEVDTKAFIWNSGGLQGV